MAALHRGRLVHRDLSADNIMVDGDGRAWLVDFDQAVATADGGPAARDDRALRETLAGLVGADATGSPRLGGTRRESSPRKL